MFQLPIECHGYQRDYLQSRLTSKYHLTRHFEMVFYLGLCYQLTLCSLFDFIVLQQHYQLYQIVLLAEQIHYLWLAFQLQLFLQIELVEGDMDV